MLKYLAAGALALVIASPALADDDRVTPRQRASPLTALKRIGCTAPRSIERDDDGFEVDDARCRGGRYDIKLNRNFKVVSREKQDRDDD